jgi:hypothetical protein
MHEVADKVLTYFMKEYAKVMPPPIPHSFEYWIGGYGSTGDGHEIWKISLVNGTFAPADLAIPSGECGIVYGGQPEAIHRLLMG